jgi:hypothetical protein
MADRTHRHESRTANNLMIPMKPYDSGSAQDRASKRASRDWWVLLPIGLTPALMIAGDLSFQQGAVVGLALGLLTSGLVWTVRRRREQQL